MVGTEGKLRVALVNRSDNRYALTVHTDKSYTRANQLTLKAPTLSSTSGVTFGGATVASDGTWTPTPRPLTVNGTSLTVTLPVHTAMVITYSNG